MHSHTAVNLSGSMFVFGGERKGHLLNELWRFDFDRRSWDRILTHGTGMIPNPMSRHAAILCPTTPPQMKSSWSEPSQIKGQSCSDQESVRRTAGPSSGLKQSPSCSLPPAPLLLPDRDHKKAIAVPPPKSISMCFGFNQHHSQPNNHVLRRRNSSRRSQQPLQEMNVVEATRKAIKYFRVHSALSINMCWRDSGITMSDHEDEEENQTSKDISDNSQPNDGNSRISTDTGLESESRAISPPISSSKVSDLTGSNYATVLRRRRKRRPRPFSEQIDPILYESVGGVGAAGVDGAPVIEDVDMEWPNFGHKRHTVHESMSYYSLCFPSPQLGSAVNHPPSRSLRKNISTGGGSKTSDRRLTNVHTFSNSSSTATTSSLLTSSAKSKSNPPPPEEMSYRKNELFSPDGLDFTLNEFEEDDVLDFRRMSVNFQQPMTQSPVVGLVPDVEPSPEAEESETSFIEKEERLKSGSTSSRNNYHKDGHEDEYQRLVTPERQLSSSPSSQEMDGRVPSMFVFGGREERTAGFTERQAMPVWKLCLNI